MTPFIKTLVTVISMMFAWHYRDEFRAWGSPQKRLGVAFVAAFLWTIAFSALSALLTKIWQ